MNSIRCSQCKHYIEVNAGEGKIYGCDRSKCVFEPTTKNNLGVDCISRAEVLKLMQDNWHTHNGDWAMQESMDDIRALPSVTPQEPRWISVSERLPKEDGEYLATIYDTDENYKYMDIAELEDGIWQYKGYIKVLAWMPIPKPYEPQESEE